MGSTGGSGGGGCLGGGSQWNFGGSVGERSSNDLDVNSSVKRDHAGVAYHPALTHTGDSTTEKLAQWRK